MWQDEQPPIRNSVLPLAGSARCDPRALAGTVCGMVRSQNAPRATTTATAASKNNVRIIGAFPGARQYRNQNAAATGRGGANQAWGSALGQAVFFVTVVAAVADHRDCGAQALERGG